MVKYITLYLHYNHLKKRNKGIMTNYKIKDHLGETVKTVQVKSIEELNDIIYDLKDYHGFMMNYTYEEVK
tara:strand:- start:389 stop:598 length:210 start_codon:yes stop_codon:yes gene_type:complete